MFDSSWSIFSSTPILQKSRKTFLHVCIITFYLHHLVLLLLRKTDLFLFCFYGKFPLLCKTNRNAIHPKTTSFLRGAITLVWIGQFSQTIPPSNVYIQKSQSNIHRFTSVPPFTFCIETIPSEVDWLTFAFTSL